MTIKLNHTIVHAKDKRASARFLTELFGLPARNLLEIITRPYGSG